MRITKWSLYRFKVSIVCALFVIFMVKFLRDLSIKYISNPYLTKHNRFIGNAYRIIVDKYILEFNDYDRIDMVEVISCDESNYSPE